MSDRRHQAQTLYHAALQRPAHQRAAFLLEATAGDGALRDEVESLLAQSNDQDPSASSSKLPSFALEQASRKVDVSDGRLGHYRLLEKIGAGGMGVVYRAHDERLDRDVALKLLPGHRLSSEAARLRFRKEAFTLAKLNHPNIAAIYDFDTHDGADFLVMEYVPGTILAEQLAHGSLPQEEVLSLATQIVAALEEAHERGIIHRDMKPGNIMVTPRRQAKILDFGLARLLQRSPEVSTVDDLNSAAVLAGTLPYMAPEQFRGQAADARTDIYAFGTVLYEMATGERPFRAKVHAALVSDIQAKAPVPPRRLNPRIAPGMEQIILKCLEKNPHDRYQSANQLLIDLKRCARTQEDPRSWLQRPLLLAASLVLASTVALSGVYLNRHRIWPKVAPPPAKVTLAVLPFENLTHDPQQDYFCDGLTEQTINQLGRVQPQRLAVIARTSAMQYKGTHKRVDEIGRELGVAYLLEAGVRREAARVRIDTQLVQVRDQTALWSESYDYDVAGVLTLESDVATRIAGSLAIRLLPDQQRAPPTPDPAAYDAYLKGRYHWHKGAVDERRKAFGYFQEAVELDPNFAPGYADLASYYAGAADLPARAAMAKAKSYALKAIELDENLTQAHTALAEVRFFGDWDWLGAEQEFQRALALNPSDAEAHRIYSYYLLVLGRFPEALTEVERARQLDPLSLLTSVNGGWTFYFARQYGGAIEQCKKALQLDANSDGAHACLGWSYRATGVRDEALRETELSAKLSPRDPARLAGLAWAYARFNRKEDAGHVLAELRERAQHDYVSPYLFGVIYAAMDDNKKALDALNRAYTEHDTYLVRLNVDDAFDSLRKEPRFEALSRRIGLPRSF